MVLSTKHSYGRERSKYRICTFSVDRWNLQGSYAKLRIKIVDPFEHLATVSAFAWLLQIDSVNDIIKTMISANIIIS